MDDAGGSNDTYRLVYVEQQQPEQKEGLRARIELPWSYEAEKWMYGVAFVIGIFACIYTVRRFVKCWRKNFEIAARLLSYKISLSVADSIIIFIYAPTQLFWITSYWWFGGDFLCRAYKFIVAFGFHLTGNMQCIIAIDRLYIMTRINQVNAKNSEYNTKLVLFIAWTLALICSIPQLFIFRIERASDGNVQCVSSWTMAEYHYMEEREYLQLFSEAVNYAKRDGNETILNETIAQADGAALRLEGLDIERKRLRTIEMFYNVFHLASMVFLPYVIELVCYTLIIALLNDAIRGQFLGFRGFIKSKLKRLPCIRAWTRWSDSYRRRRDVRASFYPADGVPTEIVITAVPKKDSRSQRRRSHATQQVPSPTAPARFHDFLTQSTDISMSPDMGQTHAEPTSTTHYNSVDLLGDSIVFIEENRENALPDSAATLTASEWNIHDNVLANGDAVPEDFRGARKSLASLDGSKLLSSPAMDMKRRCSAPCPGEEVKKPSAPKPWLNTVRVAKRATKKKAFYMLTLNLLFWLPYILQSIIFSAIVVDDAGAYNYNFVVAIVCFNAITNILL